LPLWNPGSHSGWERGRDPFSMDTPKMGELNEESPGFKAGEFRASIKYNNTKVTNYL